MKYAFEQALASAEQSGAPLRGVVGQVYRALRTPKRRRSTRRNKR